MSAAAATTLDRPAADWYGDTRDGEFVLRNAAGEIATDADLLAAVAAEVVCVAHPFGGVYYRAVSGPGVKTIQVRGEAVTVWLGH